MKFQVVPLALSSPLALLLALSVPMAAAFVPPTSARPACATTISLAAVDPSHLHDLPHHAEAVRHVFSACASAGTHAAAPAGDWSSPFAPYADLTAEDLASDAGYLFPSFTLADINSDVLANDVRLAAAHGVPEPGEPGAIDAALDAAFTLLGGFAICKALFERMQGGETVDESLDDGADVARLSALGFDPKIDDAK